MLPAMFDFIVGFFDWLASSLWGGRRRRRKAREDASLRARGVIAPATVVSATTYQGRSSDHGRQIKINYTVDVQPEHGPPFQAEFAHWSSRRGYTAVAGKLVGEAGTQIWVTYDPANPSEMMYEYSEEDRQRGAIEWSLDERRLAFNALAEPLEGLRTSGAPADAVIVLVDDLQLPYPRRESYAVRLHVDVTPPGQPTYRATIPALLATSAASKYSAGRAVFVRFDVSDPGRVVLDSARNRELPA